MPKQKYPNLKSCLKCKYTNLKSGLNCNYVSFFFSFPSFFFLLFFPKFNQVQGFLFFSFCCRPHRRRRGIDSVARRRRSSSARHQSTPSRDARQLGVKDASLGARSSPTSVVKPRRLLALGNTFVGTRRPSKLAGERRSEREREREKSGERAEEREGEREEKEERECFGEVFI